jgi:hypothetical protein
MSLQGHYQQSRHRSRAPVPKPEAGERRRSTDAITVTAAVSDVTGAVTRDWYGPLLTERDPRPPFWQHVLPYGEIGFGMTGRLALIDAATPPGPGDA